VVDRQWFSAKPNKKRNQIKKNPNILLEKKELKKNILKNKTSNQY
jgi:hypothetical protein